MKQVLRIIMVLSLLAVLPTAQAFAQDRIAPIPSNDLEIRVWTNKAEGKSFGQGEHIIVYFQANRDCFVTLYNLDTRGDINLLFPYEYDQPNYIEGGRVYSIPDYYDEFELFVDGPPGTEYIQAVASIDPFSVPPWPSRYFEYEEYYPVHSDREAVEFLHYVNKRYFPLEDCGARCAIDYTYFEVRRNWEYDWDDYYTTTSVNNYYYDPWDWCGTVYVGYPLGAEIWINGFFYGYAPCFVPRITVGWHHFRIWHGGYWWWDRNVHIYAGGWYEYGYDDIRYKDRHDHYSFKPKRRGSSSVVSDNYFPDKRHKVYTREAGYVSKDTYVKKYVEKTTVTRTKTTTSPYFSKVKTGDANYGKYKTSSKPISTASKGKSYDTGKTGGRKDTWQYYKPKTSTQSRKDAGYQSTTGSRKTIRTYDNRKSDYSGTSKKSSGDYSTKKSTKKSGSQPIFVPDKSSKKSTGSSGSSSKGKSGSSGKTSTYSAPKKVSTGSSGYSGRKSAPSSSSGTKSTTGTKKSSGSTSKGKRR